MDNEDEDDFDLVDVGDETSESKMRLTRTARAYLNCFMAFTNWKDLSMYVHVAYASTIPAEFFSKEYIGKSADYMMKTKKIQKCQTMLNYISKVKIMLERDYESNTLPSLEKLRQSIATNYLKKCIKTGESLVTSASPMTKEDLKIMCNRRIGLDRPSANEDRCLISYQYIAMVRITEPRNSKKKDHKFINRSSRTPFVLKLTRVKSSTVQELAMIVHYSSYAECSFHCMASLIAINCDSSANLYSLINASKSTSS